MKMKWLSLLLCMFLLTSGVAYAHSGHAKKDVSVLVNGVAVNSPANHIVNSKLFVSIDAFARLFDKEFSLGNGNQTATFNGKTLEGIRIHKEEPTAWIQDLAAAVGAQKISWDAARQEAYVLVLPEGSIQLTPVVPAMGEHWANLQDMPIGPIYGVYNGKLVFIEYMIAQEDFIKGVSHTNLGGMKGVPSPSVVQSDIEFQEHGHEGFEIPHYDIHAYFITDEQQQQIK